MNIYVWSDTHFGHANIIKYCNRPFTSVEEMDATMIKNHNDTVNNDDLIIFNGDFSFYKKDDAGIFAQLKGRKILVKGNHDYKVTKSLAWEAIHDIYEFIHEGQKFVMCHYPMFSWNKKFHGSIHLYGHVHNIAQDQLNMPNAHNICVEYQDYCPKNVDEFRTNVFNYQTAGYDNTTRTWGETRT